MSHHWRRRSPCIRIARHLPRAWHGSSLISNRPVCSSRPARKFLFSHEDRIYGEVAFERRTAMSTIRDEVLAANEAYVANFGDKGALPMPPGRHFAILTCMDARLDPAKYAGLAEGDAHVIRNAGGRASDDAIRSLVISYKLLGTRDRKRVV